MSKSTEAATSVKNAKSATGASGGAGAKGPGISIGLGSGTAAKSAAKSATKAAGIEIGAGEKGIGVGVTMGADAGTGTSGAGKTGGAAIGFSLGDSAGKAKGTSSGLGDSGARSEKTGEGVTLGGVSVIPESVVSPLIGAGANVYIMTNELTQSMRQKLGTSWPFVQDTLNSRYTKLLAGGVLASVGIVILWKIIRRLTRGKQAESEEEDTSQWTSHKTYELTPVVEKQKQQAPNKSEGDGAFNLPTKIKLRIADTGAPETCKKQVESEEEDTSQWMSPKTYELTPVVEKQKQQAPNKSEGDGTFGLPTKIQLRIADTNKAGAPETCKARDPTTRHRHTHHHHHHQDPRLEAEGRAQMEEGEDGEEEEGGAVGGAGQACSPRYSEQQRGRTPDHPPPQYQQQQGQCGCGHHVMGAAAQPRLLYSVRDSSMMHHHHHHPHPHRALDPSLGNVLAYTPCPASGLCSSPLVMSSLPCAHNMMGHKGCCMACSSCSGGGGVGGGALMPAGALSPMSYPHHHAVIQSDIMTNNNHHRHINFPGLQQQSQLGEQHGFLAGSHGGELTKTPIPWAGAYSHHHPHHYPPPSPEPGIVETSQVRSVNQQTDVQPLDMDLDSADNDVSRSSGRGYQAGGGRHGHHHHHQHQQHVPTCTAQSQVPTPQCTNTPLRQDNTRSSTITCPSARFSQQLYHMSTSHAGAAGECHSNTEGFSSSNRALALPPLSSHQAPITSSTQQPVVQLPSESSCSQFSNDTCPSHNNHHHENHNSQNVSANQDASSTGGGGEVVSQERSLLPQQSSGGGHQQHSAQDYPSWHAKIPPAFFPGYQPDPLSLLGAYQQAHGYYRPYLPQANVSMFLTPSGGLLVSSPRGLFHTAGASPFMPASAVAQSMAGYWTPPASFLYPQSPMLPTTTTRHVPFNSNFNLSNSNASAFMQEAGGAGGGGGGGGSPSPSNKELQQQQQEGSSSGGGGGVVRVMDSDHSVASATSAMQPPTLTPTTSPVVSCKAPHASSQAFSSNSDKMSLRMREADATAVDSTFTTTTATAAIFNVPETNPPRPGSNPTEAAQAHHDTSHYQVSAVDAQDAAPSLMDDQVPGYLDEEPAAAAAAGGAGGDWEPQDESSPVDQAEEGASSITPPPRPPFYTFVPQAFSYSSEGGETQL